jgi:hypothetical protein
MSALLHVEGLSVRFPTTRGDVAALEESLFRDRARAKPSRWSENSGSGKSTAALGAVATHSGDRPAASIRAA